MSYRVGLIGTGKLGMPVGVAIAARGHQVVGYDVSPLCKPPNRPRDVFTAVEAGPDGTGTIAPLLDTTTFRFVESPADVVEQSDIVFLAVQTPHDPRFEGVTRLTEERQDFDYRYLRDAVEAVCQEVSRQKKRIVLSIISTVLPGTIRRHIRPIIDRVEDSHLIRLCYNPYFIAMGTVLRDFYEPEFVLLGTDGHADAIQTMKEFYRSVVGDARVFETTIENAELIKVAYNTMISTKIAYINTLMEICDKTPNTNIDEVSEALALGTRRIVSPAYLRGGMGDGGGCHPRDNIAMSWLSNHLSLRFNFFDAIMRAREEQTGYLADLAERYHRISGLPIVILGTAFKPDTALTTGSPAVLLANLILERGIDCRCVDPFIQGTDAIPTTRCVFVLGCRHALFSTLQFPAESIVIDPHRVVDKMVNSTCTIHSVGHNHLLNSQ